jgi:NAD-dependent dihydropyrimidine dehydrogenase PreA subunit
MQSRVLTNNDSAIVFNPPGLASGAAVTYVISEPCVDVKDRACVEQCPVDCIYEGGRMLCIQPDECVDCGACEPGCPVEAIYYEDDLPAKWSAYAADNARWFSAVLPCHSEPLGSAGGAQKLGPLSVDTELVRDASAQGS